MTRSLPFDELGDYKPIPKPNAPQQEIPLRRARPTPPDEARKRIEQIRKQHGL